MELHLKIIGTLLICLGLIHAGFAKYFKWKLELSNLSLINRQMMQTHTFFIALTVFLMGILCMFCGKDLIQTDFGRKISFGLAIFWTCRLLFQFFVYSPQLWRNKRLETMIHVLFSVLWMYFSVIFWKIAIS